MKESTRDFVLKITLQGSRPPIWRRLRIGSDETLGSLHFAIQIAMGWENDHPYEFMKGRERFSGSPFVFEGSSGNREVSEIRIRDVLSGVRSKLTYVYDFGDSWTHEILVEKGEARVPGSPRIECLNGKGACPPEDCGGIWGYYQLLETLADPDHEDHEEMMEWIDGPIDPDAFDLEDVNKHLMASFGEKRT